MPPCLRDYMHANGLRAIPPCFYCGRTATTFDHSRPRRRQGATHTNNLQPACAHCNARKGARTREGFRRRLEKLEQAAFPRRLGGRIAFHGEGARGGELRRLRLVLDQITLRKGALVRVAPGERLTPARPEKRLKEVRTREQGRPRWRGRFTFKGGQAIRAVAAYTGCSFAVIERFVLGQSLHPASVRSLETALHTLQLSAAELRELTPSK